KYEEYRVRSAAKYEEYGVRSAAKYEECGVRIDPVSPPNQSTIHPTTPQLHRSDPNTNPRF
ncbi:MAG: hypothetical protein EA358_06160, partial [Flavobacteriales bacterium]